MPLAKMILVSFVLISPSTVILLNDSDTLSLKASFKAFLSIQASVVKNASIVAISGDIIPEPFTAPPIMASFPPNLTATAISLCTVSVVIMALANLVPLVFFKSLVKFATFFFIFPIGSLFPIMPVEAIRSSFLSRFSLSDKRPNISSASCISLFPTQQFALPLFTITARLTLFFTFFALTITDPDLILFVVKTAAHWAGLSENNKARSGRPLFLIPQLAVLARNPLGEVTPPLKTFIGLPFH